MGDGGSMVMVGAGGQSAADLDIVPCQGLIGCFGVPDWLIRIHSEEDTHWLPSNLLPFIYILLLDLIQK